MNIVLPPPTIVFSDICRAMERRAGPCGKHAASAIAAIGPTLSPPPPPPSPPRRLPAHVSPPPPFGNSAPASCNAPAILDVSRYSLNAPARSYWDTPPGTLVWGVGPCTVADASTCRAYCNAEPSCVAYETGTAVALAASGVNCCLETTVNPTCYLPHQAEPRLPATSTLAWAHPRTRRGKRTWSAAHPRFSSADLRNGLMRMAATRLQSPHLSYN